MGGLGVAATGDLQQFSLASTAAGSPRSRSRRAAGGRSGVRHVRRSARRRRGCARRDDAGAEQRCRHAAHDDRLRARGRRASHAHGPSRGASGPPSGRRSAAGVFGKDVTHRRRGAAPGRATSSCPTGWSCPWEVEVGVAYQLGPAPAQPGLAQPARCRRPGCARASTADRARRGQGPRDEGCGRPRRPRARRRSQAELDAEETQPAWHRGPAASTPRSRGSRRPERARYANWPRERILLLASVLLTGPTTSGSSQSVSLEGFLDQKQRDRRDQRDASRRASASKASPSATA